jgi:hypothetical protein
MSGPRLGFVVAAAPVCSGDFGISRKTSSKHERFVRSFSRRFWKLLQAPTLLQQQNPIAVHSWRGQLHVGACSPSASVGATPASRPPPRCALRLLAPCPAPRPKRDAAAPLRSSATAPMPPLHLPARSSALCPAVIQAKLSFKRYIRMPLCICLPVPAPLAPLLFRLNSASPDVLLSPHPLPHPPPQPTTPSSPTHLTLLTPAPPDTRPPGRSRTMTVSTVLPFQC